MVALVPFSVHAGEVAQPVLVSDKPHSWVMVPIKIARSVTVSAKNVTAPTLMEVQA